MVIIILYILKFNVKTPKSDAYVVDIFTIGKAKKNCVTIYGKGRAKKPKAGAGHYFYGNTYEFFFYYNRNSKPARENQNT